MRIESMLFGARLRQLRMERGYTQSQVARVLGCTPGAVCQYELGIIEPTISRLVDFSNFYLVSLDWLLKGEGTP